MGQHSGRIHIQVKEPKDWQALKNVPDGLLNGVIYFYQDIDKMSDSNQVDVVFWGEDEVAFGDLNRGRKVDKTFDPARIADMCSVVKALAVAFGDSAVIIADSTFIGGNMCTSRVCYLGDKIKYEYFSFGEAAGLFETTNINDITTWLSAGSFEITPFEKEYLCQFSLNLDNYRPSVPRFLSDYREIRVSNKKAAVVAPAMDQAEVKKIISTQCDALIGKTFVVTGKLYHFSNRNELKAMLEGNGAKLSETLNDTTDFLITNEPNSGSSKNKKAQMLGIKIITEEDLVKMMS